MLSRFAPSPTGYLHLGHALAAKEAFGFGDCLLRIEDIDHTRCKLEYTEAIYEDLEWLGFDWLKPVRMQNQHYGDYLAALQRLLERGLAYPCPLTRGEIKDGQSPRPRHMSPSNWEAFKTAKSSFASASSAPSLPFAIRLNLRESLAEMSEHSLIFKDHRPIIEGAMNDGAMNEEIMNEKTRQVEPIERDAAEALQGWIREGRPDPIIGRKDIAVSYHIAVAHDDAAQNITHIVRGMDLFEETPLHVLIQALMGWPTPVYHHHALLLGGDGEKLSKRGQDTTIRSLREKGLTAGEVLDMASI